jgi:DNA-binding CsgD family transcriptional regulator
MTHILLILDLDAHMTFTEEDPRSMRDLLIAINSGADRVGSSLVETTGLPQWAVAIPPVDTVVVQLVAPPYHITRRQYQVLFDVADGLHAREIAERMGITPRTVYQYTSDLKEIFQANNLRHLIYLARRKHMLVPDIDDEWNEEEEELVEPDLLEDA